MYLDSRGYVTVGVGFLLSTAADATNYTFYLNPAPPAPPPVQRPGTPPPRPVPVPSGPQKATDAQIKAEWTNINGQAKNHLATFYQRFTTMKMQQSDIDFALTQKINTFEGKARQTFANWDDFPACAQLALLDMIYNLGSLSAFPSLVKLLPPRTGKTPRRSAIAMAPAIRETMTPTTGSWLLPKSNRCRQWLLQRLRSSFLLHADSTNQPQPLRPALASRQQKQLRIRIGPIHGLIIGA